MTTSTRVYGTSNRKCASMTSSALFTSVAESTVIFLPMVHVGCLRASATVARETRSGPHVRNGPPDAVRMRRASSVGCRPATHCSTALCSESTGTDRKSTRLNSSHLVISYAVFCLKKKTNVLPLIDGHERTVDAYEVHDPLETLGVNDRTDLSRVRAIAQQRIHDAHMLAEATILDR